MKRKHAIEIAAGVWCMLLVLWQLPNLPLYAADHFDGLKSVDVRAADIADLYTFPAPDETKPHLVMIMDVFPFANLKFPKSRFSDAVEYAFRIRRAAIQNSNSKIRVQTGSTEFQVICTFDDAKEQGATCRVTKAGSPSGGSMVLPIVNWEVGKKSAKDSTATLEVFAGTRLDPFFTNAKSVRKCRTGSESTDSSKNDMSDANVLSLVVKLDVEQVLGQTDTNLPLFAILAETRQKKAGHAGPIIDRMGRVEVNIFLIRTSEKRKIWNEYDPFAHSPIDKKEENSKNLKNGLCYLDSLDGEFDWDEEHALQPVLLNDFLLVDMGKASKSDYEADGYLEIEMAAVKGTEYKTSGGRRPNEDVIDRTLTVFINGLTPGKPLRTDGVTEPTKPASDTFPYLQPAVSSFRNWIAHILTSHRHKKEKEKNIECPLVPQ